MDARRRELPEVAMESYFRRLASTRIREVGTGTRVFTHYGVVWWPWRRVFSRAVRDREEV